jgi:NADPH2:quinone reductase
MRAAFYDRNGAARHVLQLAQVETPQAGPGAVRVRLATSGVNASDVKAREGGTRKLAYPRVIPHRDGGGIIDQIGDGVAPARLGQRVWTWNAQWKRAFGTCADYVVLPQAQAVRLPDHVDFDAGACLGIPAMTAWQAVSVADTWAGFTLLIAGGADAVGHYAIRFVKARGAVVITTIRSAAKAELARRAGADHVIDYKRDNVGQRVMERTDQAGVDAVIELDFRRQCRADAGGAAAARHDRGLWHRRRRIADSDAMVPGERDRAEIHPCLRADRRRARRRHRRHHRMIADKLLINNVALTLPLAEVVAAHEAVEQGKAIGNVVLRL